MKKELFGFTWAHTSYIYFFLGLMIILGVFLFFATKNFFNRLDAYGWKTRGAELFKHFSRPKKIAKIILFFLAFFMASVAWMRPQRDEHEEAIKTEGRDWIIALDISRSMLAKDMTNETVDRLAFAKNKISKLVHSFDTDRVGLILFAGSAFMYCPLTADHGAFISLLDAIDSQMIALGSTSIEQPIAKAIETFEKMPDRKNKVLVMFTDGEDFAPDLSEVRSKIQKMGLTVFTVGVGTKSGAPIPIYDDEGKQLGFQKDRGGSTVITRLDEDLLRDIAMKSGGQYISASENNTDLNQLLKLLERFEREGMGEKKMMHMKEFYFYFSAIAGLLSLVEWLL